MFLLSYLVQGHKGHSVPFSERFGSAEDLLKILQTVAFRSTISGLLSDTFSVGHDLRNVGEAWRWVILGKVCSGN